MKVGIIYMATSPSGKSYIGQTINMNRRIITHKNSSKNGSSVFYKAIKKYGWNNFEWSILYKNIPQEKLNELEKRSIIKHNTLKKGYNSTTGGDVFLFTEEVKKKRRGKNHPMYGKKHSTKTRKKISESNKGKRAWNKGIPMSKEARAKLSKTNTGKACLNRQGEKCYNAKLDWIKIDKIRKRYINESISYSKLAREYNVSPGTIHDVVNNRTWVK